MKCLVKCYKTVVKWISMNVWCWNNSKKYFRVASRNFLVTGRHTLQPLNYVCLRLINVDKNS